MMTLMVLQRLVRDFYKILNEMKTEEIPDASRFQYDAKTFAFMLRGMLFPNLDKVVFLDDDVVIQRDLSPLWEIDIEGKENGAQNLQRYPVDCCVVPEVGAVMTQGTPTKEVGGTGVETEVIDIDVVVTSMPASEL
ncbi:hypothetical protein TSUD_167400 [Trifolium subterraneum]|nr:hypothetical protein TSUD_167400 [Trifolium subterraneum]